MTVRVVPEGLATAGADVEALTARPVAVLAGAAQGMEEPGRSGVGVDESGTSYATGDAAAASSYLVAGG